MVFGNEQKGIREEVKTNCFELVHILMLGFTESLNIYVAVSVMLFDLIQKEGKYHHPDFQLSNEEREELRLRWHISIVKKSDLYDKVYQKH